MADRDIPSVPVTTLAGLASVSDCELIEVVRECTQDAITENSPLSFQCWASFQYPIHPWGHHWISHYYFIPVSQKKQKIYCAWKTMRWQDNWFKHSNKPILTTCKSICIAAAENPLEIKIEFNCSELKGQYVEQQSSVTNINELPHLLQAILNIKPTVFKSGGPQYQQQRQRKPSTHFITAFLHFCRIFIYPRFELHDLFHFRTFFLTTSPWFLTWSHSSFVFSAFIHIICPNPSKSKHPTTQHSSKSN